MKRLTTLMAMTLVLTGAAWAQQSVSESRAVAPDGVVEIENLSGSVEVVGWGQAEVDVTGTLGRGAERLDISGDANHTRIRVVLPRNADDVTGSDLMIRVPAGSRVEVETVSADILVADVLGALELESVSGDVTVRGTPGRLEAATVSGEVDVEQAPDGSDLASVSGDVEVMYATGRLEAASVSGDVKVKGGSLERAELATTSGSIHCDADLVGNGSFELESMSGTVVMVVPASVSAEFDISTFSGAINNDIGPEPKRTDRYTPGQELSFSTGSGGARVTLTSFSGTVELRTR